MALLLQGWDSVLLVGHSYGGPLVLRLAAERPTRIAGVVTLGIGLPKAPSMAGHLPWLRQGLRRARLQGVG